LYGLATLNQNIDSRKRKYLTIPQVASWSLQICRILPAGESIRRMRLPDMTCGKASRLSSIPLHSESFGCALQCEL
jgi:hypothetical protein